MVSLGAYVSIDVAP